MIESMIVVNTVANLLTGVAIGYLFYKTHVNRMSINSFPDPYMVFDEMMKQRIPILTGPDGKPILPEMGKKEKNPITG